MVRLAAALLVWLVGAASVLCAVSFTVTPDRTRIAASETIVITAQLASDRNLGNLVAPDLPASSDFSVLSSNQNQSSSTSVQFVNGKMTQSTEHVYVFTYVIAPSGARTFTFPALTLDIGGTPVTSQAFVIEVGAAAIANPDIQMSVSIAKKSVWVGEQVLLSVTVAQKPSAQVRLSYEGFAELSQAITNAAAGSFSVIDLTRGRPEQVEERLNGEQFISFKLRYALFALKAGSITLPAVPFTYGRIQRAQRRGVDPFDAFFGGGFFGGGVQVQPATLTSNAVKITVKALPAAPADFSGTVAPCELRGEISSLSVAAGEAVTLKLILSGSTRPGNLSDPVFPALPGFEIFDPEKQTVLDTTASGVATRKAYKYLLIPRSEGKVEIPRITYTAFNPTTGTFTTSSAGPFALSVSKGSGVAPAPSRFLTQENIREVGQDIRYIKTASKLVNQHTHPHREVLFWGLYAIPFMLVVFSVLYRLQADRNERDGGRVRQRKALAAALRSVAALKTDQAAAQEYAGRLAALLNTYISDRFCFVATGLTLDDLTARLKHAGVTEEVLDSVRVFFDKLDALRFAGGANAAERTELEQQCVGLLNTLENCAAQKKSGKKKRGHA